MHQARLDIFGSLSDLVISPFGSKALTVGAMMAAMDHDLRIAYLEAVKYTCQDLDRLNDEQTERVQLWLNQ